MKINDDGATGTFIIMSILIIIYYIDIRTIKITYKLINLNVFYIRNDNIAMCRYDAFQE